MLVLPYNTVVYSNVAGGVVKLLKVYGLQLKAVYSFFTLLLSSTGCEETH